MEYHGIDDGGGDYGDELVDVYRCLDCDQEIEVTSAGYGIYEDDPESEDAG